VSRPAAVAYEPSRRGALLDLWRDVWGRSMSAEEFDWWFDANPAGPRILSLGEDGDRATGVLALSSFRMMLEGRERLGAFAVHAATRPEVRGKGLFQALERANEAQAAEVGVEAVFGFPNAASGPILVHRVGWRDLAKPRVWARPARPARERGDEPGFDDALYRRVPYDWPNHIIRDTDYLRWRFVDTPRKYRVLRDDDGWAVTGSAEWDGRQTGFVADLVAADGRAARRLLRRAARAVDARLLIATPNSGETAWFAAAGFVPTHRTLRLIGKELDPSLRLSAGRRAWRFTIGDLDFL